MYQSIASIYPAKGTDWRVSSKGTTISESTKFRFTSGVSYQISTGCPSSPADGTSDSKVTPYGKYSATISTGKSFFNGYSYKLINGTGVFDTTQLADQLCERLHVDPDDAFRLTAKNPARFGDNYVGLLYNLLCMFYAKDLEGLNYFPDGTYYADGLVSVQNKHFFGVDMDSELEVTDRCAFETSDEPLGFLRKMAFFPSINWTGILGFQDFNVLNFALGEWNFHSPLGVLHQRPRLAETLGIRTSTRVTQNKYTTLSAISSPDILRVITTVVSSNRLQLQFDLALSMVAQVLMVPKPTSVEGLRWTICSQIVHIPRLAGVRGHCGLIFNPKANSLSLEGVYDIPEESVHTYRHWQMYLRELYYHSIALSEAVYAQLYEYSKREGGEPQWPVGSGLYVDVLLASRKANRDPPLLDPGCCGLDRFETLRCTAASLSFDVQVLDDTAYSVHSGLERKPDGATGMHRFGVKNFVPYLQPRLPCLK